MNRTEHSMLVLEDDEDTIESLERTVQEYNGDDTQTARFVPCVARTAAEAADLLRLRHIDCAILDLRVPEKAGDVPEAGSGANIIQDIVEKLPIPIVIYSGHTEEVPPKVKWPAIVVPKEAGQLLSALKFLGEHDRLMTALAHAQREIRHETARIFHESLWPRWQKRCDRGDLPSSYSRVVARQIAAHLWEYFELSLADTTLSLADEFYFVPSLRERLHTGDLIELKPERADVAAGAYIIVTPQCDMANNYPAEIMLAKLEPVKEWKEIRKSIVTNNNMLSERSKERLTRLINQNYSISLHFIPPCDEKGPWNINFRKITTFHSENATELKKVRFASVTPQFLPNIMSRLAGYIGRYGQPDLDLNELAKYATFTFPTGS